MTLAGVVAILAMAFLAGLFVGAAQAARVSTTMAVRTPEPPAPAPAGTVLTRPGDALHLYIGEQLMSTRRCHGGEVPVMLYRQRGHGVSDTYHYQRTDDRARVHVFKLMDNVNA
jgi:hypothetical protein